MSSASVKEKPGKQRPSEDGVTLTVDGQDFHLGYSRIAQYLECPKKYKYNYIDRIPQPRNNILDRGTAYHNTLEVLLDWKIRKGTHAPRDLALKAAKRFANAEGLPESEIARVMQAVEYYHDRMYPLHNPISVEESFEMVRGGVKITGRIDLYQYHRNKKGVVSSKKAKIVDHKFSFDTWAKDRAAWGAQPIVYQWAAEDVFNEKYGLEYAGFDYNIIRLFPNPIIQVLHIPPVSQDQSDWFEEQFADLAKAIKSGIFFAHPTEKGCQYCSFRKLCNPVRYSVREELIGLRNSDEEVF